MEWAIDYEADVNGRIGRTTVKVCGPGGAPLHRDRLDMDAARDRKKLAKTVAPLVGEEVTEVLKKLDASWLGFVAEAQRRQQEPQDVRPPPPERRPLDDMPADVIAAAEAMLRDPLLMEQLGEDVAALGAAGEFPFVALTYLVGTSRLLKRPLSLRGHGPSSSGKSYLVNLVSLLFPPEAVIRASQMTPQALYHMKPGSLMHRFVVAGERSRLENDDRAEATRALREMISEGRLSKLMPVRGADGLIETVLIEHEGPIAFVETTTLGKVFDEDENRCVAVHTDEREEQTRRIIQKTAEGYAGKTDEQLVAQTIQKHHAIQRMLEQLPVVIPFAGRVAKKFAAKQVEARRAFPHLMGLVQVVALLFQRQRERDDQGRVVAEKDDYFNASTLLAKPLLRLLGGGVSEPAERFLERLRGWAKGVEFTAAEAKRHETASKSAVYAWIAELVEAEVVEVVEEQRGRSPARWKLSDQPPSEATRAGLPSVEAVFG